MLHEILKVSYEFARWQIVCHNFDTSSGHRKSILTKNEYTSLANCKIYTKPTMMIFVLRQLLLNAFEWFWLPRKFTMAFW